ELPGTPSGEAPRPLTTPYGREPALPAVPPRPGLPPPRKAPLFTVVTDLDLSLGYSDNLFITPDILGFRPVRDGLTGTRPRIRGLVPLSRVVGLVGDYSLNYQKFLDHGDAYVHSGTLFAGYRPANHRHAEVGIRGGMARVSEFERSNTNEAHAFVDATWGPHPFSTVGGSASVGFRDFPERSRFEREPLLLGTLPIVPPIPLPGDQVVERRGQEDLAVNVIGRFNQVMGQTARLQLAYDYTLNDSDTSLLDYWSHRVSLGVSKRWTSWLGAEIAYSVRFRGFTSPVTAPEGPIRRRDTIHDVSLAAVFSPAILRAIPLTRSSVMRLGYGGLVSQSNIDTAELDRNFLWAAIEIGFRPITSTIFRKNVFRGFDSPAPSRSFSSTPG
ncbi:MAG: hypothetical protein ACREQY_03655, partial [Candidatus Binatia bacterium]